MFTLLLLSMTLPKLTFLSALSNYVFWSAPLSDIRLRKNILRNNGFSDNWAEGHKQKLENLIRNRMEHSRVSSMMRET